MKKFIVLGFQRSGTHRIKEYLYKNIGKKKNTKRKVKDVYSGLLQKDIFFKNKNFYVFNPFLEKKFEIYSKKKLLKKNILSTHSFYEKVFFDFKDYNFILTIRDPLSVIASTVHYVTKKNILNINKQYKIKSPFELANNKKIIYDYIFKYNSFYKTFLSKKSNRFLKEFIVINYNQQIYKKLETFKFKKIKIKKSKLHSTNKNKKIINILKKNYDLSNSIKIYKKLNKLCNT